MSGLLLVLAFVLLLLLGVPVAFALIIPAAAYLLWPTSGLPLLTALHTITHSLDSFPLLAVPLFILVGNLMNHSGITTRLFHFASVLVSHWRGGLCHINILTSLVFSGSSGAALADIGGVGNMEIQAMRAAGYSPAFASAVTVASATIGPMFPPSVPIIIYATVAEASAVKLLVAGILPALLAVVALMVQTAYLARRRDFPVGEGRPSLRVAVDAFKSALPALLTPVVLIAGLLFGVFTATEAAAATVAYILLINAFVYRELTWARLVRATRETVRTTSVLMIMVAAASLFTRVLALERVPQSAAGLLISWTSDPALLLIVVVLILVVAGMFLESVSALVLLTPVVVPPLLASGIDPIHLGVVVVYTLMLGLLTPPMGMSLFLVSNIAGVPVERILRELLPYYIPLIMVLLILVAFPGISTWIPSLLE
jgi:tripartite ATP-independent transporter DctM subunit